MFPLNPPEPLGRRKGIDPLRSSAYAGQFAKARQLTRRAGDSANQVDKKEAAASYEAAAAMREAVVGNAASAKQSAQAAVDVPKARDTDPWPRLHWH